MKIINNKHLNYFFTLLIILLYSLNLNSSENRIIFKLNDYAYTSLDLEKRLQYLDFVGSNRDIDRKIIIDDFISANLFNEYYNDLGNRNNYESKINEIFKEISNINKKNNKKFNYEINNEYILDNIRIDYIRKIVLENIFNSNIENLNSSSEDIDLLYSIKVKYINLKKNEFIKLKNYYPNLEKIDYSSILIFLNENKIDYFLKEREINNINLIDRRIRNNILLDNIFFIIEKELIKSLVFIEKRFETFDGIIADLYSIRSEKDLSNNFLRCENLINQKESHNITHKEYKLIDLNNNLKNNLININDYVKYFNDEQIIYIVLCNIKFDKEILDNINFNKIINLNISEIENKFINKYAKIYNLVRFDE